MDKSQFIHATGIEPSDELFRLAERVFRNTTTISFADVCKEMVKYYPSGSQKVLTALLERLECKRKSIADLQAALLAAASDADSDTTWEKAAEVLGIAEVIRYKMDNQLDLTALERVYIINHLK